MSESYLSHARYGKDKIRVLRVVREGSFHRVVEYNVTVLLEGDIDISYTKADNSVVVATDSMKNITYYLAKTSPHVMYPERFALHLGTHLVSKYAHIHKAFITIEQLRWGRLDVNGQAHTHAFLRDGDEKRFTDVEIDATKGKDNITAKVTSGIRDLLVLKTTGSAFESFVRDEYTTLVEVNDRIFSTSVDLAYTFKGFAVPSPTDEKKVAFEFEPEWDGEAIAAATRKVTLDVFATDESASVQATLYKMGEQIIEDHEAIGSVTYKLPNKHYVPIDMGYIGVDNLTPSKAEVFLPLAAPSGLISATISRK